MNDTITPRFDTAGIARPSPTTRTALPTSVRMPALDATPPPPPPPARPGIKKVSFDAIKPAGDKKKKTDYHVFANPAAAALAATIVRQTEEFESLKGSLDTNKAELKFMVCPEWFKLNHGKQEVPSSVSVPSSEGEVLVTFQNKYKAIEDEAPLIPFLGDRTGDYFRQAFELKVDGDKLPADRTQDLINELVELFTRYDCLAALEHKSTLRPTETFHTARHTLLTPEQNFALDQVCPVTAVVKTKGRK